MTTRSVALALERNISAVATGAFGLDPRDVGASLLAAHGLMQSTDKLFPLDKADNIDQVIFYRWNMLELLHSWGHHKETWFKHMPEFSSRLLWQFVTCALPMRFFVIHVVRIFWPMLFVGLADYEVSEPYRNIMVRDVDLTQFSTAALVKRITLLQSLPACDRPCFLDLSAAYSAMALQAGQRQQEEDMYAYLGEVQGNLQSAFCESIIDCARTRETAELVRTTAGLLHMVAELSLLKKQRLAMLHNSGVVMRSTDYKRPVGIADFLEDDFWGGTPVLMTAADDREAECFYEKNDTTPVSRERVLKLYRMLDTVGQVLTRFGVEWFASHGTLLGAVRHAGHIPHDCDLDLSVFAWDLHKLRNASLLLALQRNGYFMDYLPVQHLFTVWRVSRPSLIAVRGGRAVNHLNRFDVALHIFVLFDFHEKKYWKYETDRIKHNSWSMDEADLRPLTFRPFGSLTVPVPAKPKAYLDAMYGKDWPYMVRSMSALTDYEFYEPTLLSDTSMAQPTGPLLEVDIE